MNQPYTTKSLFFGGWWVWMFSYYLHSLFQGNRSSSINCFHNPTKTHQPLLVCTRVSAWQCHLLICKHKSSKKRDGPAAAVLCRRTNCKRRIVSDIHSKNSPGAKSRVLSLNPYDQFLDFYLYISV